jgi:protein involved in sex pheromone biosynthesis
MEINDQTGKENTSMRAKKQAEQPKRITTSADIDEELYREIRLQAVKQGRKTGFVIDDAIRVYLDHLKKQGQS